MTTETVYVVRDASGEYLRADDRRTPASDEAQEFASIEQARDACTRATDRVLARAEGGDGPALVCGNQVQVDRSGVGHCWVDVGAEDIPASIREEIESEMIDGGKEKCEDFFASNGLHYRW